MSYAQVLALPLDGVAVGVARLILGADDKYTGLSAGSGGVAKEVAPAAVV